jgi:hypothetical protein
MATANSSINIAELDFDKIKQNLKTYLKSQPNIQDYDYESSIMSTILDLLAYNTHYNSFYLNMVANEMFLDTALKRSSVVSHAKLLNYTPTSDLASKALVNIVFNFDPTKIVPATLTIPKYTKFYSESIDNINYPFVTQEAINVPVVSNSATFSSVELTQGQPVKYSFSVNLLENPTTVFKIPDSNIDISTLFVYVYPNSGSTTFTKFNQSIKHLTLDSTTAVFFIQEAIDGFYEIYFGDGILGKALETGNIVVIEYITTKANIPNGVSQFTLMDNITPSGSAFLSTQITKNTPAIGGKVKESINSIKYNAPKAYAAQNRAVTKSDYIQLLENNSSIIPIEAVNVWGGEENNPPEFGKMYICIKPKGGYVLTTSQKYKLINEVIKPFSIVTVVPEIIDVDYTYVKISSNVLYNNSITTLTYVELINYIKLQILSFSNTTLNTFDSIFSLPDLITKIKSTDSSIITCESTIQLEKKFYPMFGSYNSITLNFDTAIQKGTLSSKYFNYIDPDTGSIVNNVAIEESPILINSIQSISVLTGGSGYITAPTVEIYGDGSGAIATAEVVNGVVTSITIVNSGTGYTQAVAQIVGGGGSGASVYITLSGNVVPLRSFYYNGGIKNILQTNIGEINYINGTVTLNNFIPYISSSDTTNPFGVMSISITPQSSIFYSTKDKIITLDAMDETSILVNLNTK